MVDKHKHHHQMVDKAYTINEGQILKILKTLFFNRWGFGLSPYYIYCTSSKGFEPRPQLCPPQSIQKISKSPFSLGEYESTQFYRCRRRNKSEKNAKVVGSVWVEEFIQFLAALAVLPRTILKNKMNSTRMIWKKRMNSSISSKSSCSKSLARQGIL